MPPTVRTAELLMLYIGTICHVYRTQGMATGFVIVHVRSTAKIVFGESRYNCNLLNTLSTWSFFRRSHGLGISKTVEVVAANDASGYPRCSSAGG
ncbi:hypothetical protein LSAT2_007751 [Lamellibrachia satsuma]|nr:hypothetical protein LSAT2_007751 [Lamellibrachia satsuma]